MQADRNYKLTHTMSSMTERCSNLLATAPIIAMLRENEATGNLWLPKKSLIEGVHLSQ